MYGIRWANSCGEIVEVYDKLKRKNPDFQSKVVMIDGEFNQTDLSISAENRELIKDSHIVFHGAATVRFDDKLCFAVDPDEQGRKRYTKLIILHHATKANISMLVMRSAYVTLSVLHTLIFS